MDYSMADPQTWWGCFNNENTSMKMSLNSKNICSLSSKKSPRQQDLFKLEQFSNMVPRLCCQLWHYHNLLFQVGLWTRVLCAFCSAHTEQFTFYCSSEDESGCSIKKLCNNQIKKGRREE